MRHPRRDFRTNDDTDFKATLERTWAVVNHSSNPAMEAVIKGIPMQAKWLPMPYLVPDDFGFNDFNYGTPSANIQQGDTITVSGGEIYTVITGSYNQTSRTRGILFCARTT